MLEQRVQEGNGFHKPASLMQQLDQWLSGGTSAKALSEVTPKVGQCSVQQKDSCLPFLSQHGLHGVVMPRPKQGGAGPGLRS